ncbi:MAG: hypothetical protein AB7G68_13550 [Nitrospiraceae bacterium]
MTIVRCALLTMALLAVPALGLAHGTDQHVLGTVTAIETTHMDVKTTKGASVTVQLTDQTKFISKGVKRPSGQPEVGDRVVIDVKTDGTVVTATEVQYSNPQPKTP